ncbi:hypothetical protein GDO86_012079 [Hymenochirus boettgeri]|uniref:Uncharacterized protein n=1 Tax=Hymenochirus boettgeri TaxID=247094 RepID=A0A8T2JLZ9_9PIPI|nr:hypothetical protein GDO86_012079 [Hymenochirus boettgeri]
MYWNPSTWGSWRRPSLRRTKMVLKTPHVAFMIFLMVQSVKITTGRTYLGSNIRIPIRPVLQAAMMIYQRMMQVKTRQTFLQIKHMGKYLHLQKMRAMI